MVWLGCLVTVLTLRDGQVAYQRILQLTYVDELLAALKALFVKLYQPFLSTFVASLRAPAGKTGGPQASLSWDLASAFAKWDSIFDDVLRGLENKAAQVRTSLVYASPAPSDVDML